MTVSDDDQQSRQRLAETTAAQMMAEDQASRALGIVVDRVAPGRAATALTVTAQMINGHDVCHGGVIFTLADTAFALACNSAGRPTLAQHCSIEFVAPGRLGDRLSAIAEQRHQGGRSGIYDVQVYNQQRQIVALFRGRSRTMNRRQ